MCDKTALKPLFSKCTVSVQKDAPKTHQIPPYPTWLNRKMLNLDKGLIQKIQVDIAVWTTCIKLGIMSYLEKCSVLMNVRNEDFKKTDNTASLLFLPVAFHSNVYEFDVVCCMINLL